MSGLSLTFDIHTFVLAGIGGTTIQIKISGLGEVVNRGACPFLDRLPPNSTADIQALVYEHDDKLRA